MSTRSVSFFNSRTLGFLMGCDEDDKKDERVWDGDILLPYNMDDFDDNPYTELKDLLQRLPENSSAPMLSCSGKATSYINVQPVTSMSRKNSEIVLVENSATTTEVSDKNKNSDLEDNMAKEEANKYSDLNKCVAREVVNKNSDSVFDEYVAQAREVSNKNSDLGMSMTMEVVNKNSDSDLVVDTTLTSNTATKPEDPPAPVMNNLLTDIFESCVLESEPTEASSDTLANVVKSIGIIDSSELDLDVPTDINREPGHEITKNIAPELEHKKAELVTINNMPIKAAEESGISEGQQCENVTLSETSDEMYAAIEDTVYMNPGGKDSGDKEDEESDPNNMYSKVDKVKKRTNRETKSYDASNPYATVNKPSSSKQMSQSSDNLGARPKQRSPRVPAPGLDSVDYSEYEVSHTDRRTEQPLFNMPIKAAEESGISEGQQCENVKGAAVSMSPETIDISDNCEGGEEEATSPTLLNYRSICENIIQIHTSDMLTLRPGVYVSDPIIDMYLDYLHRKVSPALQQDIFIFPTLFYQMLSTTGTRMKPPVNIFDKGCKYDNTRLDQDVRLVNQLYLLNVELTRPGVQQCQAQGLVFCP